MPRPARRRPSTSPAGRSRRARTSTAAARSSSRRAITSGRPRPRATAPIDALFRAVDRALAERPDRPPAAARLRRPRARRGPRREGGVTVAIAPPAVGGRARRAAATRRDHAARTSSRPRSRPTSRRSTCCSPRSTGRARPRRPATASGAAGSAGRRASSARSSTRKRPDRHDGLVRALGLRRPRRPGTRARRPRPARSRPGVDARDAVLGGRLGAEQDVPFAQVVRDGQDGRRGRPAASS